MDTQILVCPKTLFFGKGLKIKILYELIKIWARSKLKAFPDDNFSVAQMLQILFVKVQNFVGKGEMMLLSNCLFSHNVSKCLFVGGFKGRHYAMKD